MQRTLAGGALAFMVLIAAGSAPIIQPGKWEARVETLDINMPGAPPQMLAALKGRASTVTTCVTAEQASRDPATVLHSAKNCRFLNHQFGGGTISSNLVCTGPTGQMNVTSSGTYTRTSYSVTGKAVMTGKRAMTMTTRTSGRWLGPC